MDQPQVPGREVLVREGEPAEELQRVQEARGHRDREGDPGGGDVRTHESVLDEGASLGAGQVREVVRGKGSGAHRETSFPVRCWTK